MKTVNRDTVRSDRHFKSVIRSADFILSNLDTTGKEHERARRMLAEAKKYAISRDADMGLTVSELFVAEVKAVMVKHA